MRLHLAASLAATTLLAACGGGGHGGGFDDGRVDVERAWLNWLAYDANLTMTGRGSDNAVYTLVLDVAPRTAAAYPKTGEVGPRSVQRVTLVRNGASQGTTETTLYYRGRDGLLFGASNDAGECATAIRFGALPTVALPGSSGLLYDATQFDGCSSTAAVIGSSSTVWSVETEAGIVFFCTNSTLRDTAGVTVGSEQDCIEAGADGSLGTLARVAVELPASPDVPNGFELVARNYDLVARSD